MMLKNPTVVRSFARGISGKVPASGAVRWMAQMMRESYAHDIPFEVVMPDGTKHEVDPAARKAGGSKQQAERRAGAFGEARTAIPSP